MNCILEPRYEELNVKKIIAVMQLRKESLKKFRLVLDSNSDLGDTTAAL